MRLLIVCCLTSSFAALAQSSLESANSHFKEAEAAVAAAGEASARATTALRSCKRGTLQMQFTGSLARLEAIRKGLESARREAQAFRSGLEGVRRQIEKSKGETYSGRLIHDYATPVDTTLAPLITGYAEGITAWSAIFLKYGAFCAEPGFTEKRGAEFVGSMAGDIEALAKRSGELVATAATARATLPVEVAARRR